VTNFGLVIFDCDGVLVDSEEIGNRALAETLTACGLPTTTRQAVEACRGRILADVIAIMEERHGGPLPEGWIDDFEALRALYFKEQLTEMPGVRELVVAAREAGIDVAVGTQGKPEKVALTLALTGLDELFAPDAVFTSYEVPRGKPHPDLYLRVAERRGHDPAACAVIEDTAIGVAAGVAAGMSVYGLVGETSREEIERAGGIPFSDFGELLGPLLGSSPVEMRESER
jgi:HAD superfamily hydrolase (TIGR01509 family)